MMTTSADGHLDVYDYMYKQNEPALSLQVRIPCKHTCKCLHVSHVDAWLALRVTCAGASHCSMTTSSTAGRARS